MGFLTNIIVIYYSYQIWNIPTNLKKNTHNRNKINIFITNVMGFIYFGTPCIMQQHSM